MTRYLEGKKLLLLGGGADMVEMTKLAQSMGCIVYIIDYYDTSRSPAKLVADHYADISIADYEAVVAYIRKEGIDGVMTGYTDSYLAHYLKICELAGLPHYGSERAFGIATDKMLFKQACIAAGVGVIPGCNAYDFDTVEQFAASNGYPLMLKPTDNSGSRGVIKCEKPDDLRACYEYALSFSRSGNVIVERFMDCDSIGPVYQFNGKKAKLVAVCDRDIYTAKGDGSAIVSGTRYPSKYLDRYIREVDAAMIELFEQNGFSDGMVSPMAFVDDDGFYMCEMCYRPSGGHHFTLINDQNGVNGLALLIEFAVTGKIDSYDAEKETPCFSDCCGMIHIVGEPEEQVALYAGLEEIAALDGVLEVCQELKEGQTVGKDGTTAQNLLSVWLRAKTWSEYELLIQKVRKLLVVKNPEGRSIVRL